MNVQQAAEICNKAQEKGHECICQFISEAILVERGEVAREIEAYAMQNEYSHDPSCVTIYALSGLLPKGEENKCGCHWAKAADIARSMYV